MNVEQSLEVINRATWARDVEGFLWDGWSDAGERVAMQRLQTLTRDQPILDVGVGCGRTLPLLRSISSDYTAIDYTPAMVYECLRRFPDARVLDADARDLSQFEDGSFALVSFSLNGIDAAGHDDRAKILAEAFRVLRPGGAFQYSTHNKLGPGPKQRPWTVPAVDLRFPRSTLRRLKQRCVGLPTGLRNYWRYRAIRADGNDWCIRVAEPHDFGIVVHFISPLGIVREATAAGFSPQVELYDDGCGRRIRPDDDTSRIWYFNVVAFKPVDITGRA